MARNDLSTILDAPWLIPQIEQLERARAAGRFPAALLIHEQRGAGGEALARFAARLLLCRGSQPPCGSCRDCRLLDVEQHPDFITLAPLEDSKLIRVEQVRELCDQLALTSHGGFATVAMICPADSMNANAANALLKTLEEPRPGVTLILVSTIPSRLPATILSRCQRLRVGFPTRQSSIAWLEQRRGKAPWAAVLEVLGEAPFDALSVDPAEIARLKTDTERSLLEALAGRLDLGSTAERWGRADSFELRLSCIENWLTACIDSAMPGRNQSRERSSTHLPESVGELNMAAALRVLDGLYELRALRLSSINRPLALEQVLWGLARAWRPVGSRRAG